MFLLIALSAVFYAFPTICSPLTPGVPHYLITNDGPYYPRCRTATRAPPHPLPGLAPTACEDLIPIVCGMATLGPAHEVYRDRWVWASLPGCALGYYLPQAAELPDEIECQFLVYKPLVDKCAFNSSYNAGGINVGDLPTLDGSGTSTRDENAIRYMMASTPLTSVEDSVFGEVVNES